MDAVCVVKDGEEGALPLMRLGVQWLQVLLFSFLFFFFF